MIVLEENSSPIPVLSGSQRATPGVYEFDLDIQGQMEITVHPAADYVLDVKDPELLNHHMAVLDTRSIRRDLTLRPLTASDEMPIGGGASKPAFEILAEAGVPPEVRGRVAALVDDRGPLWIPGIRRAVSAFVTPRTEIIIVLRWVSPTNSQPEVSP